MTLSNDTRIRAMNTALERMVSDLGDQMKDCVKGRPIHGVITDLSALNAATGLPQGWIASALMSRLLQFAWPGDYLDVDLDAGLGAIRVPARFGSQRLFYEAGPFPDP